MIQILRRGTVDTVEKAVSVTEYASRDRLVLYDADGAEVAIYRLSAIDGWSPGVNGGIDVAEVEE